MSLVLGFAIRWAFGISLQFAVQVRVSVLL